MVAPSSPHSAIDRFFGAVRSKLPFSNVFNPWRDYDAAHDVSKECPEWRFAHLQAYMSQRLDSGKLLLVAEAPGYQGCRFSGVAMTSERGLLGASGSLFDNPFFDGHVYRTSKEFSLRGSVNRAGMTEPTATVVWGAINELKIDPRSVVLWNAFAWHPHKPGIPLSNRAPTDNELSDGKPVLVALLNAFPNARVFAVGQKAQGILKTLGIDAFSIRHPANGGVTEFRDQFRAAISSIR